MRFAALVMPLLLAAAPTIASAMNARIGGTVDLTLNITVKTPVNPGTSVVCMARVGLTSLNFWGSGSDGNFDAIETLETTAPISQGQAVCKLTVPYSWWVVGYADNTKWIVISYLAWTQDFSSVSNLRETQQTISRKGLPPSGTVTTLNVSTVL